MICTSCNAELEDDTPICPECDAVLDPSLLDMEPPESDEDDGATQRAPAARRPSSKARPKPKPAARRSSVGRGGMPEAPASGRVNKKSDWRSDVAAEDWGPARVQHKEEPKFQSGDPDVFLTDTKNFIASLSLADKLSFFGAVALFVSALLPWRETVAEGEVLGIFGAGLLALFIAILLMVSVAMRLKAPAGERLMYWVIQLGLAGVSVLWAVIVGIQSIDRTLARAQVGNFEVWTSKPSFGVVLAAFAGAVVILGTVFGLKDTSQ